MLGTEGSLTIGGDGLTFYPENAVEDNRWIVEAWAQAARGRVLSGSQSDRDRGGSRPSARSKQPEQFKDEGRSRPWRTSAISSIPSARASPIGKMPRPAIMRRPART